MKNNYPIRYAIMPIIEQTEWSHGIHELLRNFSEVTYIVSKCYVINKTKKYNRNGDTSITYEVVFPFEETDYGWEKTEPQYDSYGNCRNSIIVDKIFNTFEEALEEANNKNNELMYKNTAYISFKNKDKRKAKEKEYITKRKQYQELEQLIEQNTDDLVIGDGTKEQTVLIIGEKNKKVKASLYEVIDLYDTSYFKVYNLTPDEYIKIVSDLASGLSLDKYNKRLLMSNNPKTKGITIFNYDNPNDNYSLINGQLQKDSNSCNIQADTQLTFYTLETFDDIIKTFAIKYSGDKLELGNKVIALRLKI